MKHFFLIANGVLSLFILSFVMVFAAQYYQVGNTATVTVNEWSVCNTVTNNCGPVIFVPTNSSAEWSNFRTNKPVCIALGSCVSTYTTYCRWYTCNDGISNGDGTNSADCNGTNQDMTCDTFWDVPN